MAPNKRRPSRPLEGEDIGTTRWEDARHWMSIYADLLEFKRGLLSRVNRDLATLRPPAPGGGRGRRRDHRSSDARIPGATGSLVPKALGTSRALVGCGGPHGPAPGPRA